MDQLEQRIRRSSKINQPGTFRDLLIYASNVRDQDEVYSYMEENGVGLNQPQFWAAKLTMLRNKCLYKQFLSVINKLSTNYDLKKHPKYWIITELSNQLQKYLEKLLRRKTRNKRSARQYELLNFGDIEKQTRKFGKIEVYIDPDCRVQYRLEDLIDFVSNRLPEECEFEKNQYERQRSSKPMSFLAKEKQKIEKISEQVNGRRWRQSKVGSLADRKSKRISLVGRISNKLDRDIFLTPDFKKKPEGIDKNIDNRESDSLLDSVQILKNVKRMERKQNKQKQLNPEHDQSSQISSVNKQRMRGFERKQGNSFSEHSSKKHFSLFSFADSDNGDSERENNQIRSNTSKKRKEKDRKVLQKIMSSKEMRAPNGEVCQNLNDVAFIEFEDTQEGARDFDRAKKNSKQSVDLENVIKEIQMQKYQSQTFSEIDSNKENNLLNDQSIDNPAYLHQGEIYQAVPQQRKRFQTLKKDKNGNLSNKNRFIDDLDSHELFENQSSSNNLYKQLLSCLEDQDSHDQYFQPRPSISERNKKDRISRISQERSYSFSQTRPRSKSNT